METAEEAAELLGQRHEWAHHVGDVGGGHVDGVGHEVAGQREQYLLGNGHAGLVLGLLRRCAQVRGHDDTGKGEEG